MALMTAKAAAEILNVTEARVYELIRQGIIPAGVAVRLGRQIRIDTDGLSEWVRRGGQSLPGGWRANPE